MEDYDAELREKLLSLKEKRNAVILAHNYQLAEIQDVADFVGDSLELSQNAAKTDADVILFCGVHFMAETASILCPDKVVLLPDMHAGCPMADMITVERLREKKKEHPKATVVCYVNSSAAVKAESDVCCTSANAVKLVEKLANAEEILAATGFQPGGVCPFGVEGIDILLDVSLQNYGTIYPAAGTDSSGVPMSFEVLRRITGGCICDCTAE